MMEGITVLNQYEGYISGPGFSGPGLLFAILAVILIVGVIICDKNDIDPGPLVPLTVVSIFLSFICFRTGNPHYESYPIWDVTIDESVSLVEFNERYEIIEQAGLIYTIKECSD